MFSPETQTQRIVQVANDDYLPVLVESFLTDRRAGGMARGTVTFYAKKLKYFSAYCDAQALTHLADLTPDFLRGFILLMGEGHNPGGVHAVYRSLRAFLRWVEAEEVIPD